MPCVPDLERTCVPDLERTVPDLEQTCVPDLERTQLKRTAQPGIQIDTPSTEAPSEVFCHTLGEMSNLWLCHSNVSFR